MLGGPAQASGESGFSELVKRGFEMLQSRQFEEAAAHFGEALKIEPASEPARKGLASAWSALGISHLHAGRLRQSRDCLGRGRRGSAGECRLPPAAGRGHVPRGDLRAARRETDRALELAP